MRSTFVFTFLLMALAVNAHAVQPTLQAKTMLETLKAQAKKEHWSFKVGFNSIMNESPENRTGLKIPPDWKANARFVNPNFVGAAPLPSHFDWREKVEGGLPPVKRQGHCGSCWAFATVGVMESAVKIREGINKKFSEQYLLACNGQGMTCDGGYYAHYLHEEPGAVLDQDLPYRAANSSCPRSLPHDEKIMDWGYVGGAAQARPTTQQIKQAIYQYGPVAVTIYGSSPEMFAYKGGIFDSCWAPQLDHMVVLVGWDDSKGIWYLRNSWGEDWGENGYMQIPFGCAGVGSTATFVDYKATICEPKPVAVVGEALTIHAGESVLLGAVPIAGQTYQWSPADSLDKPNDAMPLARPTQTTTYTLKVSSKCGESSQNVTITVIP